MLGMLAESRGNVVPMTRKQKTDPFWVALQWEDYTKSRLTYGSRVIEHPARRIKAKYAKAFARLAKHLDETDLTPQMYFTLLLERVTNRKRAPIILRVPLLGTKFYNEVVSEMRLKRRQQFAGQEDRATLAYRTLPVPESGWAPTRLADDVARLTTYRSQYSWFEWGRFWLLFGPEFSGAFLYVTPEYREAFNDPLIQLGPQQLKEWRQLDRDDRLSGQVRETVSAFRHRVRSLPCLQQTGQATLETIATQLRRPHLLTQSKR
jgi:hypothetical protein